MMNIIVFPVNEHQRILISEEALNKRMMTMIV